MISLLHSWALNMVVVLQSIEDEKAFGFNTNILICVPKMNVLTGLERHESEYFMTELFFLGELSL